MNKLYILGGGTVSYVRNHLALCAPAFGKTARQLYLLCEDRFTDMKVYKILTKMADCKSNIITNDDIKQQVEGLKGDPGTKVIFFNVAMCDWTGEMAVSIDRGETRVPSGKYAERLKTSEGHKMMMLSPAEKVIRWVKEDREDIFLVGFKTTCGETEDKQFDAGFGLLRDSSADLILANDTRTRVNMIIHEKGSYITKDREEALVKLVDTASSLIRSA